MTKQRILITGGAGFIGSWLTRHLLHRGDTVLCFDNLHPQVHGINPRPDTLLFGAGRASLVRGDVTGGEDLATCIGAFAPEVVVHLAAETGTGQSYDQPARYGAANVLGTCHLVEAIRRCSPHTRRVVLASSRAVYGEGAVLAAGGTIAAAEPRPPERLRRGDFRLRDSGGVELTPLPTPEWLPPNPASIYASTKLMQEYVLSQALAGTGTEVAVLRLQNVYGPGQSLNNPYSGIVSILSQQIAAGQRPDIYEDGEMVRDFVYAEDVARALAAAADAETLAPLPINIGSGMAVSILELTRTLLRLHGRDDREFEVTGKFRIGDVRHAVADIARAGSLLGWRPEVSLEDGLRRFVAWCATARD